MKLKKIVLKSGEEIAINDGVTVIVGPNNAGKSKLLNELNQALSVGHYGSLPNNFLLVGGLAIETEEVESYISRMRSAVPNKIDENNDTAFSPISGGVVTATEIRETWDNIPNSIGVGSVSSLFVSRLETSNRLQLLENLQHYDSRTQSPKTLLQSLHRSAKAQSDFTGLLKEAFDKDAFMSMHDGALRFMIGEKPKDYPNTIESRTVVNNMPHVSEQGDGIKAFGGMVASILTSAADLILIDEPEAFLHPPQAKQFGGFLARHCKDKQIIVATHSEDILNGITGEKATPVQILRLTRKNDVNILSILPSEEVLNFFASPFMKYYGMLDGLFSNGVVVAESDNDCTYYTATLDQISTNNLSVHFAHCSGKGKIANAVESFRKLHVPVSCIVDIDILQKNGEFKKLVNNAGGEGTYDSIKEHQLLVKKEIDNKQSPLPTKKQVIDKICASLDKLEDDAVIDEKRVESIKQELKLNYGWREFKKYGITKREDGTSILSATSLEAYSKLDLELKKIGIFIVPVGELEGFHRDTGVSKKNWLNKVIENELYKKSPIAQKMLEEITEYIKSQQ